MTTNTEPITRKPFSVGDCIILNDVEQPCGRMICVVVYKKDDNSEYGCRYLNADPQFDPYNNPMMFCRLNRATHIKDFGVVLRAKDGYYWCEVEGESVATYPDGARRRWQEYLGLYKYTYRPDVFKHIKMSEEVIK